MEGGKQGPARFREMRLLGSILTFPSLPPSLPPSPFSQVMHYQDDEVPEAKFSYDISPLATVISSKKRAWYEFLTSLMAIIGGTFTGK